MIPCPETTLSLQQRHPGSVQPAVPDWKTVEMPLLLAVSGALLRVAEVLPP